jgi:hypothetical protein
VDAGDTVPDSGAAAPDTPPADEPEADGGK